MLRAAACKGTDGLVCTSHIAELLKALHNYQASFTMSPELSEPVVQFHGPLPGAKHCLPCIW